MKCNAILSHLIISLLLFLFVGFGDFATMPGVDCDINQFSLRTLYFCLLVPTTLAVALISRFLIVRSIEKRTCLISSDPKLIFPYIFLCNLLTQFVFTVIKLHYGEDQLMSRDFLVTILGSFLPFQAFFGLTFYFAVVLKFLKSYTVILVEESRDNVALKFETLRILSLTMAPLSFLSSFMPLFGLNYPAYQKVYAYFFLIGNAFATLLFGFVLSSSLKFLIRELSTHVEGFSQSNEEVRLVLKRMNVAYNMSIFMSILLSAINFILCFDFFLRKASYFVIFQLMACPPACTTLILTVSKVTPSKQNDKYVIHENDSITVLTVQSSRTNFFYHHLFGCFYKSNRISIAPGTSISDNNCELASNS